MIALICLISSILKPKLLSQTHVIKPRSFSTDSEYAKREKINEIYTSYIFLKKDITNKFVSDKNFRKTTHKIRWDFIY